MPAIRDRALGALWGLALGDALGMPTQDFTRDQIRERYGEVVPGLLPGPPDQPIAPGLPEGSVTDDTMQALIVGRWLVDHHRQGAAQTVLATRLIEWQDRMRARGSLDLLGPSTNRALEALVAGEDVSTTGRHGTTNGAAMRVAPAGISASGDSLLEEVVLISALTHNTAVALAGAAAVAMAVSSGIDGNDPTESRRRAVAAAAHFSVDMADRIGVAIRRAHSEPLDDLLVEIGTTLATEESVPAAFAVFTAYGAQPWLALRVAASVGGDCDTIAAMVGAMVGAHAGMDAWPADDIRRVAKVNRLHKLPGLVDDLLAVRRVSANPLLDRQQPPTRGAISPYSADENPLLGGRVLSTGTVVVDLVMTVERLPESGTDQVAGTSYLSPGGNFNVLAAAARVGAQVTYLGPIGRGPMGEMLRSALAEEGVALNSHEISDNGLVVTLVEPSGERSFVTSPQAVTTDLVLSSAAQSAAADLIYVSGYELLSPGPWTAMQPLLQSGAAVVFDPGPLVAEIEPGLLHDVLGRTTWLTCNEREGELLTGHDDPGEMARDVQRRYPHLGVVLRLGPAGSLLADHDQTLTPIPSTPVEVVDSNGAGDTHVGVLMAGLIEGRSPAAAVRRANLAAAVSVTRPGPATCPTREELDALQA